MRLIDLHIHSTASDGTDAPSQLIEKAISQNLSALALTDHDTIRGVDEAREAALGKDIEFIPGCEISTRTEYGSMHIVGLWIPEKSEVLNGFLNHMRDERTNRNKKIIAKLRSYGVDITEDELQEIAPETVGRPHMAALLVKKGFARSINDAFDNWLGQNGKAHVTRISPRPEQAVRLLREIGATPVIAHPLLRPLPNGWLDEFVKKVSANGILALEAWHSSHNENQRREIIKIAQKYGLALSGGSDYHGKNKPDIELGSGKKNLAIPESILTKLKDQRRQFGLPV